MNEFLEKWKKDHRFQVKIKLLLYTLFVVIVAIYAITANNSTPNADMKEKETND